ncbi:hypothetical protein HXA34_14485 [Salipaludibacillus agaradhaerens]|uniref:hypothetical protein n=1 Tax=Salipaludibacillus agaradhaerens TaxID=76935 RepID=UPI002150D0E1|nr:hypothetical protein [Salipaludibacillus agaradhaerens]MCR6107509.1 hypothetical protein [Salipaludibacillus agaradhaerens]MCR6119538.1 hypothetical protein [Salipaludibacillus agaradhaerens]
MESDLLCALRKRLRNRLRKRDEDELAAAKSMLIGLIKLLIVTKGEVNAVERFPHRLVA